MKTTIEKYKKFRPTIEINNNEIITETSYLKLIIKPYYQLQLIFPLIN